MVWEWGARELRRRVVREARGWRFGISQEGTLHTARVSRAALCVCVCVALCGTVVVVSLPSVFWVFFSPTANPKKKSREKNIVAQTSPRGVVLE